MLENPIMAQAFSEGLVLGKYHFIEYKSKNNIKSNIENILCVGKCHHENIEKGQVIGSAVNYSRDLGNHPANILTPSYLASQAKNIAEENSKNFFVHALVLWPNDYRKYYLVRDTEIALHKKYR